MYEYLQFAVMDLCREIEWKNEEFGFVIPNPLFEFE
jgi:hypothetical protein